MLTLIYQPVWEAAQSARSGAAHGAQRRLPQPARPRLQRGGARVAPRTPTGANGSGSKGTAALGSAAFTRGPRNPQTQGF